jgi:cytochrome c5
MKRTFPVLAVLVLAGAAVVLAHQGQPQEQPKEGPGAAEEPKMSPHDAERHNPVKPTAEGLAEARRVYRYDCQMCHDAEGNGHGDVANDLKLSLHDWHDPATLAGKTDGELFYLITNGKGNMPGNGTRHKDDVRWKLVNLVRALAKKESSAPPKAEAPAKEEASAPPKAEAPAKEEASAPPKAEAPPKEEASAPPKAEAPPKEEAPKQ